MTWITDPSGSVIGIDTGQLSEHSVGFADRSAPREILITIDETGNLGDRSRGNCYLIVGCIINDRDGFLNATKCFRKDHEMKFSNKEDFADRFDVLRMASPYIDRIHYVFSFKPSTEGWETKRKIVHEKLLNELKADMGIDNSIRTLIIVDENDIISPERVRSIFKGKANENPLVSCVPLPSIHFFELQTNDFVAGAINQEINRFDSRYVDALGIVALGRQVWIR